MVQVGSACHPEIRCSSQTRLIQSGIAAVTSYATQLGPTQLVLKSWTSFVREDEVLSHSQMNPSSCRQSFAFLTTLQQVGGTPMISLSGPSYRPHDNETKILCKLKCAEWTISQYSMMQLTAVFYITNHKISNLEITESCRSHFRFLTTSRISSSRKHVTYTGFPGSLLLHFLPYTCIIYSPLTTIH